MNRLDVNLKDPQHPRDVTLVVKDGKEFQAHRDVLSQASPFFEKLLNSNMKENIEGVIRFEMIVASQMADILEFIYTDNVQISTQENAENLIEIADYLLLENLKAFASKYLEQHTTTLNCISIYHLAEKYLCGELIASTRKFICSNFLTVAESNDFLNFSGHDVEKFISSDDLVIDTEENVFEIILKWIEHAKSERSVRFSKLFRHVRLTCLSRDFLVGDVVTNDFVKENEDCMENVIDALKWIDRPNQCDIPRPHPPRKALERDVIVVTACGEKRPLFHTSFYFPATGEWYCLPPTECQPARVFSYRGKVCVVTKDVARSLCYDPEINRWSPAPWTKLHPNSYNTSSQIHDVLVVKNRICFIVVGALFFVLWQYSIDSNSIYSPIPWIIKRVAFSAVVVDKHIYVIGGKMRTRHYVNRENVDDVNESYRKQALSECARFDIEEFTWHKIAPLKEARSHAFGVSKTNEEKIFIAGGFGIFEDWLASCEVYNIATDEWQFIASLTVPRAFGKMVLIDDTIYVLGGTTKKPFKDACCFPDDKVPVEWYDHERNTWNDKTAMPISKITLKTFPRNNVDPYGGNWFCRLEVCSLKVFKGVKNNLYPIRF